MASALEWTDIAAAIGTRYGKIHVQCPVCSTNCRTRAGARKPVMCIWRSEPDFATFSCARCGIRGYVHAGERADSAISKPFQPSAPTARREEQDTERLWRQGFAEFTWFSADPIGGSLASTYLASRGLEPGNDLRFTPLGPLGYRSPGTSPAMIACVRASDGSVAGIQATFLSPSGAKLKRLTMGAASGGVRLAPVERGELAVAEGVETALSFTRLYQTPCWAALSTSGLRAFQLPAGIQKLTIAADNDGAGIAAAHALAERARAQCDVIISRPAAFGDWNDVLLHPGRAAA